MKKKYLSTIALAAALLSGGYAAAQSETDVYRLSQQSLSGSARFQSMGGAFTALGGDASSVVENPAGIGVFHNSEISISLGLNNTSMKSAWYNTINQTNDFKVNSPHFSFVGAYFNKKSGNGFSFGINRQHISNYQRSFAISSGNPEDGRSIAYSLADYSALITPDGTNEKDLLSGKNYDPYLESGCNWLSILAYEAGWTNPDGGQYMTSFFYPNNSGKYVPFGPSQAHLGWTERNAINAYDFTFGFNRLDKAYFGFSLRYTDIESSLITDYAEDFMDKDYLQLHNELWTRGGGFTLSFGTIVRPTEGLRLGVAFHSPTWMSLTDGFYAEASSRYSHALDNEGNFLPEDKWLLKGKTPNDATSRYGISTPIRVAFGAAYTFGRWGLLSIDYELADYAGMKLRNNEAGSYAFSSDNAAIKSHYKLGHTFRLGAELKPTSNLSLRLGGVIVKNPMREGNGLTSFDKNETPILTAGTLPHYMIPSGSLTMTGGIGYKISRQFYMDIAVLNMNTINRVYAFPTLRDRNGNPIGDFTSPESIKLTENTFRTVLTLGYKF